MSQDPSQPPQPQWDPQRRQWYIPSEQQPAPQAPSGGGRHGRVSEPATGAQGMSGQYGQAPPQGPGAPQGGVYGGPHQAGYVPRPPRPPKKTRKWPWIVGGLVVLFVIAVSCGSGGTPTPTAGAPSTTPAAPAPAAPAGSAASSAPNEDAAASTGVVFEVTGKGRANNITYGGLSKGLSQANGERLPWRKTVASTEGFESYALTAQNGGSGEITCRITVDGKEIASNTSSGQYAVVSCNGTSSLF